MRTTGALLIVVLAMVPMTGCSRSAQTAPPAQTIATAQAAPSGDAAEEVARLKAQVRGLQILVTEYPMAVRPEPPAAPPAGRYMATIKDASVEPSPTLTVDFVTPDNSAEFSVYKNQRVSAQRLSMSDEAAVGVVGQSWAGDYNLAPDRMAPVIVSFEEFVNRWKADVPDGPMRRAYYITVRDGRIVGVEQVYAP
jgi:hypothetical protein